MKRITLKCADTLGMRTELQSDDFVFVYSVMRRGWNLCEQQGTSHCVYLLEMNGKQVWAGCQRDFRLTAIVENEFAAELNKQANRLSRILEVHPDISVIF